MAIDPAGFKHSLENSSLPFDSLIYPLALKIARNQEIVIQSLDNNT